MPIVRQLDKYFDGNTAFLDMPRKFKIAINTCSRNCGNPESQDISFTAIKQPSGEVGFVVYVGGTVAAVPQLARPLNVIIKQQQILDVARCAAELFRDNGQREVKAKARFRYLVDLRGTEKLRERLEEKLGWKMQSYQGGLRGYKAEHVGVQAQRQKGYSYINVPIESGVLSVQKMRELASVAETFGDGTMGLTPYQNVIVAYIPDAKVEAAKAKLKSIGYPIEGSYLRWATVACAGNFCGKTLDHPKTRAKEAISYLQTRFGDRLEGVKLNVGFSGCPNGCARHLLADVGFQGTATSVNGKSVPSYNVYVRPDSMEPTLGKLVLRSVEADKVKIGLGNLIEAYLDSQPRQGFEEFLSAKTDGELAEFLAAN